MRKIGRKHPGLQVTILSGGQPIHPQHAELERGAHIVVGTPGRVLDHLRRRSLTLRSLQFLVLDEADRMLDMGFEEEMSKILAAAPKDRQTIFFSATFPESIGEMSKAYQRDAVRVTADGGGEAAPQIKQQFYEMGPTSKTLALLWLLRQTQPKSAIVFCNLKATVDEVAQSLKEADIIAAPIHGDLEQRERDKVMAKFRNLSTQVLVATDVAARGIDIADLDAVFCYDLPSQPEVYVHRIGRTGRAGKKGLAISFGTAHELFKIRAIEELTRTQIERKTTPPAPQLEAEASKRILNEDAAMETLYISGGRKDEVRPGDILGALTGEAGGLDAADIGKIEIHDKFSYVAVSKKIASTVLNRLRDGRIKGRKFKIEKVR